MEKGKVIVFEGACDGMGKTTQCELLRNRLQSENKEVVSHHFPSYGTYQGAPVEKYLSGEYGKTNELSPFFINSLYAIDRAITWHADLKSQYDQGKVILLDRYTTSSLIYQSALIEDKIAKKSFIDYVLDFEYQKLGIQEPDNVIFLHAPFDLVTEMRNARKINEGISNDIHERDLDFMKKVYESAMFIADYLSWDTIECNIGKNMQKASDIHDKVYKLVMKNWNK